MADTCTHLGAIQAVAPSGDGCLECLKTGDTWVHLRRCASCGHVGCCDSSRNKRATRQFLSSEHPLVQSFEPGEDWYWCYPDMLAFELEGGGPSPSHR